ncbi:PadR family transcriptional regulator [Agromyces seonyuensis]|uniref:PadR family transcriptional regulator n=1 Tax=Agromyces seonyuensis TaxID=2662446 RepID=A0A6I4NT42_9MICO|nr:PadR family transcriptional regulator [Agromyces seonyuensis]MWB97301.1 PadR family transcriptional regulator [Agromyces seonyuensis]
MKPLAPLGVAALGLLVERDQHPYEMFQTMLHRREDRVVKVSAGTLYRTVERLEADGLIAAAGVERAGNRPERTVYAITDDGREALRRAVARMLGRVADEYPEFVLAISEISHLPPGDAVVLLEQRRDELEAQLELFSGVIELTAAKGVPRPYLLDLPYLVAMRRAELEWLDATIAELRDGRLDWPAARPARPQPSPGEAP